MLLLSSTNKKNNLDKKGYNVISMGYNSFKFENKNTNYQPRNEV